MFLTLLLSIHSIFECGFHLRMNEIWRQTLFHTFKLMPSKHQEQLILTWIYLTMQDHKRRLTQGSWPNVDLSYKEWLHVNQDQIIQLIISSRWTTSQASLTVTYFSSSSSSSMTEIYGQDTLAKLSLSISLQQNATWGDKTEVLTIQHKGLTLFNGIFVFSKGETKVNSFNFFFSCVQFGVSLPYGIYM